MKKYYYILLLLAAAVSCKSEEKEIGGGVTFFSRTYIGIYRQGENYVAKQGELGFFYVELDDKSSRWIDSQERLLFPDEEIAKEFWRAAERNGDTTYNRYFVTADPPGCCFADNFREMHVVCTNRDLDAAHPAGSRIDDLIIVRAESCAPYVQSHYEGYKRTSIWKLVSELEENELSMIAPQIELRFAQRPSDDRGPYEVEITLVTSEGETHVVKGSWLLPALD